MKRLLLIPWLAAALVLVVLGMTSQPTQVTAGGLPCFLCHGVGFVGSALAPAVAGTKLTDEQIIQQVRNPRGVMPAFRPDEFPDDQTIISYIRAQPTGQPTMVMSPEQRSAALAMIAGVAGARATAIARTFRNEAEETPAPESPGANSLGGSTTTIDNSAPAVGPFIVIGGLLVGLAGGVWLRLSRHHLQ